MRPTRLILGLLFAAPLSMAQNFIPVSADGSFPACGATCAVLQQAQSTCVQQTTGQSNRLASENCFCQSPTLQGLYNTPDAICVAECPQPTDRINLRTWFQAFCAQVGSGVDPSPTTTFVTVTSTNVPSATTIAGGSTTNSARPAAQKETWIEGHWKWLLMLGILAIGLGGFAWLLIWLKKRHRRKVEERRARQGGFPTPREKEAGARAATPELWGPHQHMHATKGWDYAGNGAAAVIPGENDRRERRSSRNRSHHHSSRPQQSTSEIERIPPSGSRQTTSRGKQAESRVESTEVSPGPTQDRKRSRNRERKEKKYDFDRDAGGH